MKNLLSLLCFAALLCASCSIQKRVHQPGYAVEWNLGKRKQQQAPMTKKAPARQATATQPVQEPANQLAFAGSETPPLFEPITKDVFIAELPTAKAPVQARKPVVQKLKPVQHKVQQVKHNNLHKPQQLHNGNLLTAFILLLVALLLLLLGLILSSAAGVLGIIFLLVFGIVAAVLLIIAIIMVLAGLAL